MSEVFTPYWIINEALRPIPRLGAGLRHVYVRDYGKLVSVKKSLLKSRGSLIDARRWAAIPHVEDTGQTLEEIGATLRPKQEKKDATNLMCPIRTTKRR